MEDERSYVLLSTFFIVMCSPFESNSAVVVMAVDKTGVTGTVIIGDNVTAATHGMAIKIYDKNNFRECGKLTI